MVIVGSAIELFLWFYILFILARLVTEWGQMFARSWTPHGVVLVVLEVVFSVTDPPIKLLRKVIPPLRLGGMAIDLSILIVLIVCYVLLNVNRAFMPIG